jgi:hypothetical protein
MRMTGIIVRAVKLRNVLKRLGENILEFKAHRKE